MLEKGKSGAKTGDVVEEAPDTSVIVPVTGFQAVVPVRDLIAADLTSYQVMLKSKIFHIDPNHLHAKHHQHNQNHNHHHHHHHHHHHPQSMTTTAFLYLTSLSLHSVVIDTDSILLLSHLQQVCCIDCSVLSLTSHYFQYFELT